MKTLSVKVYPHSDMKSKIKHIISRFGTMETKILFEPSVMTRIIRTTRKPLVEQGKT